MTLPESIRRIFEASPAEDKSVLREKIQSDVEKFLAEGGQIQKIGPHESSYTDLPIYRNRKQQVEWAKKKLKIRRPK